MTNIELSNAVKALAARLAELEKKQGSNELRLYELENNTPPVEEVVLSNATLVGKEAIETVARQLLDSSVKSKRGLCPKCNKKPNHFFHVKTCKG